MKVLKCQKQPEFFSVINIRKKVFIEEQNVPINLEFDELDYFADHYLLVENNKAVATARITKVNGVNRLGRVAVLKEVRKQGYGSFLISEILKNLEGTVSVNAQEKALGFYQTFGFEIKGDSLIEAGIIHYPMELILNDRS